MYLCFQCSTGYPAHQSFCWVCLSAGTIIVAPQRPPSAVAGELQAATARDLVARAWTLIEPSAYPSLRLLRGALVVLYGPPGAGKSTMLVRLLDSLQTPVVLFTAEERLGPTVGERLARLGVTRSDFHLVGQSSVDDLVAFCRRVRAHALGLDSVTATTLTVADLRRVAHAAGVGVCAATLQVTKSGTAAGSNMLLHEADVVLRLDGLAWTVEKSRYQPAGVAAAV